MTIKEIAQLAQVSSAAAVCLLYTSRSFMKKTYVLDTNVLIQAPYAVECFEENTVVLPMTRCV